MSPRHDRDRIVTPLEDVDDAILVAAFGDPERVQPVTITYCSECGHYRKANAIIEDGKIIDFASDCEHGERADTEEK